MNSSFLIFQEIQDKQHPQTSGSLWTRFSHSRGSSNSLLWSFCWYLDRQQPLPLWWLSYFVTQIWNAKALSKSVSSIFFLIIIFPISSFTFVNVSIANPFMAVEYLDTQIARLQLNNGQWVYGGAKMSERIAFAADPRGGGPLIRVCYTI